MSDVNNDLGWQIEDLLERIERDGWEQWGYIRSDTGEFVADDWPKALVSALIDAQSELQRLSHYAPENRHTDAVQSYSATSRIGDWNG